MKFQFKAKIDKVGINPCVNVPSAITDKMVPARGYISIEGKIDNHPFHQTLVPIKNAEYRLHVNGPMLKGAKRVVGQIARFTIAQDFTVKVIPMPPAFKTKLIEKGLVRAFKKLTPSRQKEILKYLNFLKSKEALTRNIDKVIAGLKRNNEG